MTAQELAAKYLELTAVADADAVFQFGLSIAAGVLAGAKAKGEIAGTLGMLLGVNGIVLLLVEEANANVQWAALGDPSKPHPVADVIVTEVSALVGDYLKTRVGRPVGAPEPAKA